MMMRINHVLYKGTTNKDLRVTYAYKYEDGQFCPIVQKEESVSIYPSFAISISEGYDKDHAFIPGKYYYAFVILLRKTVELVSEHILELFPEMGKQEFDIDKRTLDRFQAEKSISIDGMTILPTLWVDPTNVCYPALRIETLYGSCTVPFHECCCLSQLFSTFDPIGFGVSLLRIAGKID